MKNIFGKEESLKLYNKDGNLIYKYQKCIDDYSWERTYDSEGNALTYIYSDGFSWERTYDSNGNELTYKNSNGTRRGFGIPEYTMEELVKKLGNFKIKK